MLLNEEKSVHRSVFLLGKESGLETDFIGHKDPEGKGSNMKVRAGNLAGTGTELLWKIRGKTGKAAILAWGKRPKGSTHLTCYLSKGPQCYSRRLPREE